ncbi:MAG: hypothetical protein M3501_08730, partial [Actinomycetota bacterium]|nr:hypothetical protein [Actinomycetota bacterium]
VELRNRLSLPIIEGGAPLTGGERGSPSAITEVREALAGLGYQPDEIRESLRELAVDGEPASLLREALQQLAVRRA